MSRIVAAASVVALLACGLLGAQTPGGQQPPTFRVEARAIEVDAFVTDRDGQFVRGLTRDDFEILEDEQPQEISAFSLVDVPIDAPATASKGRKDAVPAVDSDIVTNATEGRIYVMLLDSPGLAIHGKTQANPQAYVRLQEMFRLSMRAARQFVDESLGPNDLMAVVHVQASRSDAQSFTRNKALLRASIDRMTPDMVEPEQQNPPTAQGAPYCDVPKLRNTYEAIATVSERLGAVTGRRKAILWVNGRVPFDPADPVECGLLAAQASSLTFMYRDAMRAATRHNVAIYPIDAVGLTADPTGGGGGEAPILGLLRRSALRAIAEDTGGEAVINTNNFSPAFERIVRANSSYYLLGYRPAIDHRDAKFHAITVRVRRPGLNVRTRKGYTAPGPEAPIEARLLPGVSPEAGAALVKALPANGLGIELFLASFKGADRNGSVVLGAEFRGLGLDAGSDNRVEIAYMAIDAQGASRVAPPKTIRLPRPASTERPSQDSAIRYIDRLALPPGRHEVRVAIHQPGGATGSVVAYVDVPDFARVPLAMSGLVLTSSMAAAQPLLQADPKLHAVLSADPTTRRRFPRGDDVTAMVEVYVGDRTRAQDVRLTVTLKPARGGTVRTLQATSTVGEAGRAIHTVRLPLADLAPDAYVLTMEARAGRRTVSRQTPIDVTD